MTKTDLPKINAKSISKLIITSLNLIKSDFTKNKIKKIDDKYYCKINNKSFVFFINTIIF